MELTIIRTVMSIDWLQDLETRKTFWRVNWDTHSDYLPTSDLTRKCPYQKGDRIEIIEGREMHVKVGES